MQAVFLVGAGMWSGAVVCPASWCGSSTPRARMEICGPGPFRLRALEALRPLCWFTRSRLVTVCPYTSSALLTPPTTTRQPPALRDGGRWISIDAPVGHQRPGNSRHAVGQGDGDQHAGLSRHHALQPGSAGRAATRRPADHSDRAPMMSSRRKSRWPIFVDAVGGRPPHRLRSSSQSPGFFGRLPPLRTRPAFSACAAAVCADLSGHERRSARTHCPLAVCRAVDRGLA